jgi:hypothetical protein
MTAMWIWFAFLAFLAFLVWRSREGFTLGLDPYTKPQEEAEYAAKNPGLVD